MAHLIGLTGGMGSGKSTVAALFNVLGIPVYDADSRAKSLMNHDPALVARIRALLGDRAYSPDGALDRQVVAAAVFGDRTLLNQLNAVVHPAVYRDLLTWADEPAQKEAPYLIQESAILFEENLISRFAAIILVTAPEELRITRILQRDVTSREDIAQRMRHQWPDDRKIHLSDYVIFNDGARPLIRQVVDMDDMIRTRLQ